MADAVGRYQLLERIAAGGMAEVWKAKIVGPSGFEKLVAIKRILPDLASRPGMVKMFIDEAKLVAGLFHPNIVQVFDFGKTADNRYFIAMEYVPGTALSTLLKSMRGKSQPLPLEAALLITSEACKGLAHAHARGIVHRDVSPHNILVSGDGQVKVTDFGIAKVETAMSGTKPGVVRGKPAYMSPEQVLQSSLDARSDLFSLGCVMYELAAGRRWFEGKTPLGIVQTVVDYRGPDEARLASLPPEIGGILRKTLQSDPAARYVDAAEMEADIHVVAEGRGVVEARRYLARLVSGIAVDADPTRISPRPVSESAPTDPHAPEMPAVSAEAMATLSSDSLTGTWPPPQTAPDESVPGATATVSPIPPGRGIASSAPAPEPPPAAPSPVEARGPAGPNVFSVLVFLVGAAALGVAALVLSFQNGGGGGGAGPSPTVSASTTRATTPPAAVTPTTPPHTGGTAPLHVSPPPTMSRTPVPVAGRLSVQARPWVSVWVDGVQVAAETPLENHRLEPGVHRLRFENPVLGYAGAREVNVESGAELSFFVDAEAHTIEKQ